MIKEFLKELKESYHLNAKIYTEGSCFRLFKMLKTIFPSAKPFYSQADGHWIIRIEDEFYDINGQINPDYVTFKKYEYVDDPVTLVSAYIPTFEGLTSSYSKYILEAALDRRIRISPI